MTTDIVVYNATQGPLRLDDEGHSLGGGEFGPADSSSEWVDRALEDGTLVKIKKPKKFGDDINPQVAEAFESVASSDEDDDDDDDKQTAKKTASKKTTKEGSGQ